jgi:hypothetical protein
MLNAFYDALPPFISSSLDTRSWRRLNASNVEIMIAQGRTMWNSLHSPLQTKIEHKMEKSHPDLPVFIMNNMYGCLLASNQSTNGTSLSRVAVSLFAIACMRVQGDVGPQLLGHVYGLKKAWTDGVWSSEPCVGSEEAMRWLTSDEGCIWVLRKVDELVAAVGSGSQTIPEPIKSSL